MMATAKNKLSTDFQSAINCVPERSLLGAFGKQHHDYDHDVFNSAGSTLATPHFGPENGVHLREAYEITGKTRTVDEVIEAHRNDFEDWRYVPDGVKNLKDEKKAIPIDEAFIDLVGIVNACVEYHQSRDKQQQ